MISLCIYLLILRVLQLNLIFLRIKLVRDRVGRSLNNFVIEITTY